MNLPTDPESVVQRQLDAYNARDIDGLLGIYADDAQIFEHPATLLAEGTAALSRIHSVECSCRREEAEPTVSAENLPRYLGSYGVFVPSTASLRLRKRFTLRFMEPNLHAALLNRMACGAFVIDHERVARTFPEGPGAIEVVMIYEVRDGRIARSWSIAGPRVLQAGA